MRAIKKALYLTVLVSLLSCKSSSIPIVTDSDVRLIDGYGVLAIGLDALDYISSVRIQGTDNDYQLGLSKVEKGKDLRLFQAPEGNYCINQFNAYGRIYQFREQTLCFYVEAGEINYAGTIAFRANTSSLYMNESYFLRALSRKYPVIYKQFIGH